MFSDWGAVSQNGSVGTRLGLIVVKYFLLPFGFAFFSKNKNNSSAKEVC